MKTIRVFPIYYNWDEITANDLYERFLIDKSRYRIVIDEDNPEYLFCCISHITYGINIRKLFKKYYSNDRVIIFDGDEAISPDMNLFDYAVTYDDSFICDDRVCHRPFCQYVAGGMQINNGNQINRYVAMQEYDKRKFCNFIYSNANAYRMRDELFYEISKYKHIDSLGNHLNNVGNIPNRDSEEWFGSSINEKKNYRFSICAENGSMKGYTSEKIISAFLANSIPIYWGNPNIEQEFNPDAFINCNKYTSLQDVLKVIREIDANKEKWVDMVTAPWQTNKQKAMIQNQQDQFKRFVNHIFEQDKTAAKRCPTTTASNCYRELILGLC